MDARSGPARLRRARHAALDVSLVALVLVAFAASLSASSRVGDVPRGSGQEVSLPEPVPEPVRSLWVGDGVVDDCCLDDPAGPSLAQVVADELRWGAPQVAGEPRTGYLRSREEAVGGAASYPERIGALVDGASYDVVVVFGGNHDDEQPFDAGRLRTAVRVVLSEVSRSLPRAEVVVLGPHSPSGTGHQQLRQVLQQEAVRSQAEWIDPIARRWLADRPQLLADDGFHLNAAGHQGVGELLADVLREALAPGPGTAAASAG